MTATLPTPEKVTIGTATLYLGDSLQLLRDGVFGKVGAIVSDPPYGIGYQHGGGGRARLPTANTFTGTIIGDDSPFDPRPWIDAAPSICREHTARNQAPRILLWGADHFRTRLPEGGTLLAWDKHLGRGADDSFTDCEWAWCASTVRREVFRYLWKGVACDKSNPLDRDASGKQRRLHVSQKPVELMRWSIDKARPLAGLPVLDPYMGSGSTIVAAMSLGLPSIGVEIDPEIFRTTCERMRAAATAMGVPL